MSAMPIDNTLGAVLVASFFSFMSMGIVVTIAVGYFTTYPNDNHWIKACVVGVLITCLADTAIQASWAYTWMVTYFGTPEKLALMPWQARRDQIYAIELTNCVAEAFFCWRIWVISLKTNWYVPLAIFCLGCVHFGSITWCCALLWRKELISQIIDSFPITWLWVSFTLACDVLITCTMYYHLSIRAPTLFEQSQTRLRHVINRFVQANTIALIMQIIPFILFNLPATGFWWELLDATLSKALAFGLISSLTSRGVSPSTNDPSQIHSNDLKLSSFKKGQQSVAGGVSVHIHDERHVDDSWSDNVKPVQVALTNSSQDSNVKGDRYGV